MNTQGPRQTSRLRRRLPPDYECVSAAEARLRQRRLGAGLRDAYAEVIREPVPEDFRAILERAGRR